MPALSQLSLSSLGSFDLPGEGSGYTKEWFTRSQRMHQGQGTESTVSSKVYHPVDLATSELSGSVAQGNYSRHPGGSGSNITRLGRQHPGDHSGVGSAAPALSRVTSTLAAPQDRAGKRAASVISAGSVHGTMVPVPECVPLPESVVDATIVATAPPTLVRARPPKPSTIVTRATTRVTMGAGQGGTADDGQNDAASLAPSDSCSNTGGVRNRARPRSGSVRSGSSQISLTDTTVDRLAQKLHSSGGLGDPDTERIAVGSVPSEQSTSDCAKRHVKRKFHKAGSGERVLVVAEILMGGSLRTDGKGNLKLSRRKRRDSASHRVRLPAVGE